METQVRLGKVSIGKDNILCAPDEPVRETKPEKQGTSSPEKPKNSKHKYGEYENVLLSDGELDKLKHRFPNYLERIDKESPSMQICREGDICYIKRTIGMPLIGT